MKGILLAGGSGSRLFPLTKTMSKQLLPVYDKPTIYYPLSVLMLANIRDILVISTPRDIPMIEGLLGDGSSIGMNFSYAVQDQPRGIADAFNVGADFIAGDSVCLILGDNIFYGEGLPRILDDASKNKNSTVFPYRVSNPEAFGVIEFDENGKGVSLEEKPAQPKSDWAVTGLYFYDSQVVDITKNLKPSARGELEITDVNKVYLEQDELSVCPLGRGVAWLDSGTPESLINAAQFVQTIEERQGLKIACIEEIALAKKFISQEQFVALAEQFPNCSYGDYLKKIVRQGFYSEA